MNITPKQYALSLYEILTVSSKNEAGSIIKKFIKVIINNNHISKIPSIVEHLENHWNKQNNIVTTEITSARKLDASIIKYIKTHIAKISNTNQIEINEVINQNIIGGVIIKFGDKIIDGSLSTELKNLKSLLTD